MELLSVLVVEPNESLRQAIKWVLSHNKQCRLLGGARNEKEAVTKVAELQPAMVLLDVGMAAGGMAALKRLASAFPQARVVALLSDYSDEYRSSAHAHGAFACVAKDHLEEHLAWAVQKVLATEKGCDAPSRAEEERAE